MIGLSKMRFQDDWFVQYDVLEGKTWSDDFNAISASSLFGPIVKDNEFIHDVI